jgi:hypothetical protein
MTISLTELYLCAGQHVRCGVVRENAAAGGRASRSSQSRVHGTLPAVRRESAPSVGAP